MTMKGCFVSENWVEIKIALNTRRIPTVSKRVEDLSKYTTGILYLKGMFEYIQKEIWMWFYCRLMNILLDVQIMDIRGILSLFSFMVF